MLKTQRLDEILNIVQKIRHVTVAELAEQLYASPATIRRDIALLEKSELIVKSHGGISLAGGHNRFVELDQRAEAHRTEKLQIGRTAAALVHPGDALFMDASSTVISMIPFLQQKNLTVITNSLRVADRMGQSGARVFITGGELHENSKSFGGSIAERTVRSFHADKLFFSAAGVSASGIISDFYEEDIAVRQAMIACSTEQYFLCDSSKYGKSYLFRVSSVERLTRVISDRELTFSGGQGAAERRGKEG